LFFTFSGVLDNFSGYAYVAEDSESAVRAFLQGDDLQEIIKERDHWYWISSS